MGSWSMAPEETPTQWWLNQMADDADNGRVNELSDMIIEACACHDRFSRSEMYMAQAKAFAITLLDEGQSAQNPEYLKDAASEIMALWLDKIGVHITRQQH